MDILLTESEDYSQKAIRLYQSLGRVYFFSELRGAEKKSVMQSAQVLVAGLKYHIGKEWVQQMPQLRVVATNTTGLNHIDVGYLKEKGIHLISLRGRTAFLKNIPSTAEATMALLLALARNIPWAFDDVKAGHWDRNAWRGHELKGKILGILGYGRLGTIVARYGRAFDMNVIACDPHVSRAAISRRGVKKVAMDTLLKMSDVLSLHVLLTDDTHNLLREKHLRMMKRTAVLVNTARAELIEQSALTRALQKKWIAGAATDVLWDERSDGSHLNNDSLWKYARTHSNLLIVPHIGGATYEAMAITQEYIAELVKKFLAR